MWLGLTLKQLDLDKLLSGVMKKLNKNKHKWSAYILNLSKYE